MIVHRIAPKDTYDWLLNKHYLRRVPSISFAFGLFADSKMIGIATFGTPVSSTLLKGVCGECWKSYVIELNRVCVQEPHEKNATSFLVANAMKQLPKPKIVVSYADNSKGHNGYIYQACNFIYTGLSTLTYDPVIIGQEGKHHGTSGAGRGMTKAQMLEKFGDRVSWKPRDRKHRYVFFCGSATQKKKMFKALRYKILEYPKGDNARYDASYIPNMNATPLASSLDLFAPARFA